MKVSGPAAAGVLVPHANGLTAGVVLEFEGEGGAGLHHQKVAGISESSGHSVDGGRCDISPSVMYLFISRLSSAPNRYHYQ